MKRRGFLKAALGTLIAPAIPLPKLIAKPVKPVIQSLPVFKTIPLTFHHLEPRIWISRELLMDSQVQLEAYLQRFLHCELIT